MKRRIFFATFLLLLVISAAFYLNSSLGWTILALSFLVMFLFIRGNTFKFIPYILYLWLILSISVFYLINRYIQLEAVLSPFVVTILSLFVSLIIILTVLLAFLYVASEWVLGLSGFLGVTRTQAMRILFSRVSGMQYPYTIIADGKVFLASQGNSMSRFGGPGLLIVRPLNATVLELGGKINRIVGPGIYHTVMYEIAGKIIDLRPQEGETTIPEAPTCDGAPITISVRYRYQIETKANVNERKSMGASYRLPVLFSGDLSGADHTYSQDAIGRAVYQAQPEGWHVATEHAVAAAIYDEIGQLGLQDLFGNPRNPLKATPGVLRTTADNARARLRMRTAQWGTYVTSIDIVSVDVPQSVQERISAVWAAEAESDSFRRKSVGEVARYSAYEGVREAAASRMLANFNRLARQATNTLPPDAISIYLSLLSRITEEVARDRVSAYRYFQTLEAMSRNPDANIIISAKDDTIIIDGKKKP